MFVINIKLKKYDRGSKFRLNTHELDILIKKLHMLPILSINRLLDRKKNWINLACYKI